MASLGNYSEPYVNSATLKRLYSSVVKDNIFQDVLTKDGEACTEKYCEDTSVAQVTVLRLLPGTGLARSMAGTTNNGFFNSDAAIFNTTTAYQITLLDLVDYQIDIPEVQQDMMSTDLAAGRAKILGGQVATNVNAITIAAQLAKNFNDIANGTISTNWKTIITATDAASVYQDRFVEASAELDNGNEAEGINTYPILERAVFVRSEFKAKLYKSGATIIGGSNFAQQMIADGGLSPATKSNNTTGFSGYILDMPVYMVGGAVWHMVERYLGLANNALSGVLAVMVSSIGTGRGLAFNATIKQIDSPSGAGIRMQPLYRFGAECWDGLSVVPICSSTFTNPATAAANLTVMAPASRLFTVTYIGTGSTTGTTPAPVTGLVYNRAMTAAASGGLAGAAGAFAHWAIGSTAGTTVAAGGDLTVQSNLSLYAIYA